MSSSESKSNAWHAQEAANVLAHFHVNEKEGLTEGQVQTNANKWGKNEIPPPPTTSIFALIIEQFSDLLVLILLGAAFISFILALFEDAEDRMTAFVEPAVILIILILNAVVGVVQETNAEKAIEKLKESEARDATVLRDSILSTIHAADLVPGDIIHVSVGDKVPADARLVSLQSPTLLLDESNLTGEAEAVMKHEERIDKLNAVNQDKRNMLFSGTLVVRGKATAVVTSIGAHTEMGAIAKDLEKNEEKTPLQEKLDEFGEQLSKVIGVICIVVWLINIGHFTDPDHGGWVRGAIYYFKIAVALAVAAIPEGLPAVVTTCLALGTMKMAKKNAIVRSLPSVETLGCTTVICSDKTGTITTNQMSVLRVMGVQTVKGSSVVFKQYKVEGDSYSPIGNIFIDDSSSSASASSSGARVSALNDASLTEIGRIASLCNESTLGYKWNEERKQGAFTKTGAPTEAALLVLSEKIGVPDEKLQRANESESDKQKLATNGAHYWNSLYKKEYTLEFDRDRKSMSVLVKGTKGDYWLLCKGAPESVLERCTHIRGATGEEAPLTPATLTAIKNQMEAYALEGLRCLALAYVKNPPPGQDYKNIEKFRDIESRMTFVGLTAMMDPPRPAVEEAIVKCRTAGIRVIMITGDNKVTAESICRKVGLFAEGEDTKNKSFTGSELEAMSTADKNEAVKSAVLFSRVEPKHKNELVTLLKNQGEVVAMTGDGVNDATALKKADIGIAMGSGTAVACEASKMVLQDDNFATIVMAVEEGRAIYSNTKQFIRYLISSNIGEVACIFLTAALGIPDALIPVQLLWVNLVTDGLPATALGFNPADRDIMLRSPRGRTESIVNGWMFFRYVVIGVYVGAATVMGAIWWFMAASRGPHLSFTQLAHFHDCLKGSNPSLFAGIDCEIFHNPLPSTVALSILVTIEMFNALNALSENQSLLNVTPLSNVYVLFACALSFSLHFMIIYVPFFSNIFHVGALNAEEWSMVIYISLPVFAIDETLKFISRRLMGSDRASPEKKKN